MSRARAAPPSSPGPRVARLRLPGGPWTSVRSRADPASRRLRKQTRCSRAAARPQKGRAMHATPSSSSSSSSISQSHQADGRTAAGVPPVPPEGSPPAGMHEGEEPSPGACAGGAGAPTCGRPSPTGSPRCSRRASLCSGSGGRARRRAGCRATAYGRAVPRGQCAEQHGHVEISQTVGDVHQRSSGHGE